MDEPLVSCLMVTANRPELARRSIRCFERQTHRNSELVILDDGDIDYSPIVDSSPVKDRISYRRIRHSQDTTLGDLRNRSIDLARGEWLIQWDDDDWYHPSRIEAQLQNALSNRTGASALRWTLMRTVDADGRIMSFRADSGIATPGTILFKRGSSRYPRLNRNEDGVFMRSIRREFGLTVMPQSASHLFVRIHHGANTWDAAHFHAKLRRTPTRLPAYLIARYVHRDLERMSAFRLSPSELRTLGELDAAGIMSTVGIDRS
jgi:glycosyltransferase involved in cell wall biosynthesis